MPEELSAEGEQRRAFSDSACGVCYLLFLSQSPNPDPCCVSSWFYHWEEPTTLRDPVLWVESACSCSQISAFCALWAPCAQVTSSFPSPERKLGKPAVEALVWKSDILSVGTLVDLCHWAIRTVFSPVDVLGTLQKFVDCQDKFLALASSVELRGDSHSSLT